MIKWVIFAGILLLMILLWGLFWTPYPFVMLLRSKKEAHREKGPEHIKEIRERIIIKTKEHYPSKYPNHTFDFYANDKPKSILVWVHGGSFISGTSEGAKNFAAMLADQGIIVCAINYAYAPRYAFPTQIHQLDEFLCYLPTLLKQHGYPEELPVFVGGDSAGANIAAAFTCMSVNLSLQQQAHVQLQSPQHIHGALLFCGPYDFSEDFHKSEFAKFAKFFHYIGWSYLGHKNWQKRKEKEWASPYLQINQDFPPLYVCDGKKFSFLWQGKALIDKAASLGIETSSRFYEDMEHEFQFDYQKHPEEAMQVFQDSLAFIKAHW